MVCVALTSNLRLAEAPGNVKLTKRATGLTKDSVANVSQLVTMDKTLLSERAGKLPRLRLQAVLDGVGLVLGRLG